MGFNSGFKGLIIAMPFYISELPPIVYLVT